MILRVLPSRWAFLVVLAAAGAGWCRADQLPPGIVSEQPASGPFVKVPHGYMVPYKAQIPGSSVEFEMVPVPGGKFKLGSPDAEPGRAAEEGPQVEVSVEPFWIGKYEVTWAEFKLFMALHDVFKEFDSQGLRKVTEANRVDAVTAPSNLYEPTYTFEKGEDPKLPAVSMTQYSAKHYTKWLTGITGNLYRLPAEAEWEYACRAGTTTAYSWGDDPKKLDQYGWFADNSDDTPHTVGLKKPNPWGLYDMHGNVAEWCLDQVLPDGYQQLAGKTLKARDAIVWPAKASGRALRGGRWDTSAEECRSAARLKSDDRAWKETDPNVPKSPWWYTDDPALGVGMRVVRPLSEPPKAELARYWDPDHDSLRNALKARLESGKGATGLADRELPAAIEKLKSRK